MLATKDKYIQKTTVGLQEKFQTALVLKSRTMQFARGKADSHKIRLGHDKTDEPLHDLSIQAKKFFWTI